MGHQSPNVLNYYIGKGTMSFKGPDDSDFRDLGNVTIFEFTPNITKLDHFSSRAGIKSKDRTVVLEKSGTAKIVMEEWTAANLAVALLGDLSTDTAGREVIDIFAATQVSGELKFHGTNEVGPRYEIHLLKVDFIPGQSLSVIGDTWGTIELSGEVASVNGSFGTMTDIGEEDSPSS